MSLHVEIVDQFFRQLLELVLDKLIQLFNRRATGINTASHQDRRCSSTPSITKAAILGASILKLSGIAGVGTVALWDVAASVKLVDARVTCDTSVISCA